jgi:hypothetical protein
MQRPEVERRLTPVTDDLLSWSFRTMVEVARAGGAIPVWIYVPVVEDLDRGPPEGLDDLAVEAGFEVWDFGRAYEGYEASSIRLADWDTHPNARGHRLLSDVLYSHIRGSRVLFNAAVE